MLVEGEGLPDFLGAHNTEGVTVDQIPMLVFVTFPEFFSFCKQVGVKLSNFHGFAFGKGFVPCTGVEW